MLMRTMRGIVSMMKVTNATLMHLVRARAKFSNLHMQILNIKNMKYEGSPKLHGVDYPCSALVIYLRGYGQVVGRELGTAS